MGPVYYCTGHPSNTISLGAPKFYVCSQKDTSEPLEHCDFVYPQGCSWISPYQTHHNLEYHHHVMSGRILVYDPFHHHQLI